MSREYWDRRWRYGPPCPGSNGAEAVAKAEWVNAVVRDLDVKTMVDGGCGDGSQALMFDVPVYLGVEVAESAYRFAARRLRACPNRAVVLAAPGTQLSVRADLSASLDVVFHLVDEYEYEEWLGNVFGSGRRFVAVHGTNYESEPEAHMRHHAIVDDAPREFRLIEQADDPESPGWYLWAREGE
jgi:hypothetical protein